MVVLRCLRSLNRYWYNSYDKKQKMQKTQKSVFVVNHKKTKMEIFAFCVTIFEPIRFQSCQVYRNDCLNLSFVKDKHTAGEKWPEIVGKLANVIVICFDSEQEGVGGEMTTVADTLNGWSLGGQFYRLVKLKMLQLFFKENNLVFWQGTENDRQ